MYWFISKDSAKPQIPYSLILKELSVKIIPHPLVPDNPRSPL